MSWLSFNGSTSGFLLLSPPVYVYTFCHETQLCFIAVVFIWFIFFSVTVAWLSSKPLYSNRAIRYEIKRQWCEHRWLVYRDWFELVFESLEKSSDSSRKQIFRDIIKNFFLILSCSCMLYVLIRTASSRRTKSVQSTYHYLKKIEKSLNHPHLPPDPTP